jgi:alkylation response protein AidB-like acyl-CoA dehydrogenase
MMEAEFDPADLADSAQRAIEACAGLGVAAAAARLAEDGLLGVLAPEQAGGLGLGLRFAMPVMDAAGRALLAFPLLDCMLLAALLPASGPAIVSGELTVSVAWAGSATLRGGRVDGVVGRAPCAAGCGAVLVRLSGGGAVLLRTDAPGVTVSPSPTLDADAPEYEVTLSGAEPAELMADTAAARLEDYALVLRSAAMLGAAETCLSRAVEHVSTRQQFGRPLVAFQVLRHGLARQKLGIENIRAALLRAVAAGDGAEGTRARRVAFVAASRWAPAAAESALQMHGGMGFTWDVPVHRHLRQARSWEAQGNARAVREALADGLLDANA